MITLLPRLPEPAAERLLDKFLYRGPAGWLGFNANDLPDTVRFAATGGSRVAAIQLAGLRSGLLEIAHRNNFGDTGARHDLANFDGQVAAWLAESTLLANGEALRDDVWAFIAVVLAPDIVHWRFGTARERYLGGVRNAFQRLWMRGRALDRGKGSADRWGLLTELTEDALVQISERPSIGGDPILARELGEAWVRAARHHGKGAMEPVMRRAALQIRIWNEVRSLSALPEMELRALLDAAFGISLEAHAHERSGDELSGNARSCDKGAPADYAEVEYDAPDLKGLEQNDLAMTISDQRDNASRIQAEALRRDWLSPTSKSALEKIRSGSNNLTSSERNALQYLLERFENAGVM